jgi:hypothetical protein
MAFYAVLATFATKYIAVEAVNTRGRGYFG